MQNSKQFKQRHTEPESKAGVSVKNRNKRDPKSTELAQQILDEDFRTKLGTIRSILPQLVKVLTNRRGVSIKSLLKLAANASSLSSKGNGTRFQYASPEQINQFCCEIGRADLFHLATKLSANLTIEQMRKIDFNKLKQPRFDLSGLLPMIMQSLPENEDIDEIEELPSDHKLKYDLY